MKQTVIVVAILLGVCAGPVFSGVLTLTSKGLQYMNNEQFAALQDPYGLGAQQQGQQGLWRDDGSAGGQPSEGGAPPPEYDDDENQSEQEDNEDEVEDQEELEDNDEGEEEQEALDDAPAEEVPAVEEKKSKYSVVKVKTSKASKVPKKKETKKSKKVKEQQSDEADDEDKPRPPPPMPAVLKQEMMNSDYDAQVNGVQQPGVGYQGAGYPGSGYPGAGYPSAGGYPGTSGASAPLLSRMTTYISSLLGRGGIGSDPIYMNRNAKSISSENLDAVSRTKRQVKLADLQMQPFYHVRDNIRTMVRRQPSTKLAPQPIDDFSNLSEKASKPIKLFMEPYSAPTTYQYPPIDPAQGVRGPSSSGVGGNPGGALGQQTKQASGGGGKQQQGSSAGGNNKKNNNKQSNNKGKDKEGDSEEEDSDENNSDQQYPNYEEEEDESNNLIPTSGEDYGDEDDTGSEGGEVYDDEDEYEEGEE